MLFTLLYLVGVTATLSLFPHWSTPAALLVPLAVVGALRLAVAYFPLKRSPPGSDTGGAD